MGKVILVDRNDKLLGYAFLEEAHKGRGKHHRAFVMLLFDSENRVLLQKRKHRLFDGLWDLTAISHPLHLEGKDEDYQTASDRALLREMGIAYVSIKKVGAFNYFAKDGKSCENEYCAVLIGNYDGDYKPSKEDVYEAKWVDFDEFIRDINQKPQDFTPWAVLASKVIKKNHFGSFDKV